jgi:hypothetical protein
LEGNRREWNRAIDKEEEKSEVNKRILTYMSTMMSIMGLPSIILNTENGGLG